VTGLGVWCAAGTTPEAVWSSAIAGRSAARAIAIAGRPFIVCPAPEPPPCPAFPQAHRMDRSARLALAAAQPAFHAARFEALDPTRVAILVGNSRGPVGEWSQPALPRVRPSRAAQTAVASLSGALSLALRVRGPCLVVSATCASAAHAIALGAMLLRAGQVDAVLAGGAEAALVPVTLDQFEAAGLLGSGTAPEGVCRPFDASRKGIVPGEGAAFLALERARDARERGQPLLARLAGSALGAEGYSRAAARLDGAGLVQVIRQALAEAGLAPADIGHINAHGTGTRVNDAAEAAAFRRVWGPDLDHVAVTSTKPVTGHLFGAAAAVEAILTIGALKAQRAPPTAGFVQPDSALGFVPVHGGPRPLTRSHALSTSLGFWGNTACLAFSVPA
jgi:3-oxoacyl-[acyl-carrier-protein] synthase II